MDIFKPLFYFFIFGLISVISLSVKAQNSAIGLFVEPSLTYETSESSQTYPAPVSESTGKIEGYGVGARAGFHLSEVVFLAFDGRFSLPRFKDKATLYDARSTSDNWGTVIGLQMPHVGLRVWGTYLVSGDLNPEMYNEEDYKYTGLSGYRVGAGFRIGSISLNIEYQDTKYNNATAEKSVLFPAGTSFTDVNFQNRSWISSLSFPLAL